mmetsp:Transcript_31444/g.62768  ORF Transcript_31444/g.62768 Transcript_31444/m.62768 type:complete len:226 (+) Transcript_31444:183-860(+)
MSLAWSLKNEYESGDTYHFSSGRPRALRELSTNFTPASPCAALVPATSSMPLPMIVLQITAVGLPLLLALPSSMAAWMALRSWPSVKVITSQPMASKRAAWSSDCVNSAILSSVTSFESKSKMRLSSFSCAAKHMASWDTPSWRQPSPHSTYTWWSNRVCSGVLNRAAAIFSEAASPTALEMPAPRGPVVASMPGVLCSELGNSGWPGVAECHWRKLATSSLGMS